jgi:putative xylitol transport system ATP-binding protein
LSIKDRQISIKGGLSATCGGNVTSRLKVEGLRKSFGGFGARAGPRLKGETGAVHALCGRAGARKPTPLPTLASLYCRVSGETRRHRQEAESSSPAEAPTSALAIIEQELSPVQPMMVAGNGVFGREPSGRFGKVDFHEMNGAAQAIPDGRGFAKRAARSMCREEPAYAGGEEDGQ